MNLRTMLLTLTLIGFSIEYVQTYQIFNFNGALMPLAPHPITLNRFGMGASLQMPTTKCILNYDWRECPTSPRDISLPMLRSQTKKNNKNNDALLNRLFKAAQNYGGQLNDGTKSLLPYLKWPDVTFPYLLPLQIDSSKPMTIKNNAMPYQSVSTSYNGRKNIPSKSTSASVKSIGYRTVKQKNNLQLQPETSSYLTLRKIDKNIASTSANKFDSFNDMLHTDTSTISRNTDSVHEPTTTIANKRRIKSKSGPVDETFLQRLQEISTRKSYTTISTKAPERNTINHIKNELTPHFNIAINDKKQEFHKHSKEFMITDDDLSSTQNNYLLKKEDNGEENIENQTLFEYGQTEAINSHISIMNSLSVSNEVRSTESIRNNLKENTTVVIKNLEVELTTESNGEMLSEHRRKILLDMFTNVLDKLERKFYTTTFNKLTSISPEERRENGISFAQSGLYLGLLLIALSTETDNETRTQIDQTLGLNINNTEKVEVIREILSMLPQSSSEFKFRWASRLVLGGAQNVSEEFKCGAAAALHLDLGKFYGNETDEALAESLNHMVEHDSGGAIRDTFDPDEMSGGVRAVALTTLYVRARWKSAPTVLNGTRPFRDAEGAPPRTTRMIRINDIMRYADFRDWHFHALEIPYSTPGLSLLMLIPHGTSLRPLATRLATTSIEEVTRRMVGMRVAATVPLYTLRMTLLLPTKLQSMGIHSLISSTNATDDGRLKLSHAVQRLMFWSEAGRNAFKDDGIEWDESPELELVVDRPYLFFVRWHNITLMSGNFVL